MAKHPSKDAKHHSLRTSGVLLPCREHSHEKNNPNYMTSSLLLSDPGSSQFLGHWDGKAHRIWKDQCLSFLQQNTEDDDAGAVWLYQGIFRQGVVLDSHHKSLSRPLMLQVTLSCSHQFSFIPLGTGSHLCFVFSCRAALDPSAHTTPFSPHALTSFNSPDFCLVSIYTRFVSNQYWKGFWMGGRGLRSPWLNAILMVNISVSSEVAMDTKAPYSPTPW